MILQCPSCSSRIKAHSRNSNQTHTCISCGEKFVPSHNLKIAVTYNHSEFVESINEKSIVVTMSDENAESIIKSAENGEMFCKILKWIFLIPWAGFLILCLSDTDEKWDLLAFIVVCLISNFLSGYFHKLKIRRAVNVLLENPKTYEYFISQWWIIIKDNPDFNNGWN
jgi:hypothetical protein